MAQDSRLEALRKALSITGPRPPAPPQLPNQGSEVLRGLRGATGIGADTGDQQGYGAANYGIPPSTRTRSISPSGPGYENYAISELGAGDMSQIRGPRPSINADPSWENYAVSELGPASYPPPRNPTNRLGRPIGSSIMGEGNPSYGGREDLNLPTLPGPPPSPPFNSTPTTVEGQRAPWLRQDINKGWMERGEGPGLSGDEWTQANQGPSESVQELGNLFRPTEELWQQAARKPQTVSRSGGRFAGDEYLQEDEAIEIPTMAPGAQQSAGRELYDRVGPDQFELYKANIPLQEQALANQGNLAQQEEVSRGNLGVAKTKSETDANFFDRLAQLQSGNVDLSRISAGGRSVSFDTSNQRVPQALVGQLTAAKDRLEQARSGYGSSGDEEATYRQALGAVFAQDQASPQLQELAIAIAMNPETANVPISDIEFEGADIDLSDPRTLADLNRLLNYSRGAVGGGQ